MTNKYGNEPLGKSVEEVESESSNTVNSPVPGEQRRTEDSAVIPGLVSGNASGVPAVINMGAIIGDADGGDNGSGPNDGTVPENRDSSET